MTSGNILPPRLTKVDELIRHLHYHIDEGDECFYLWEYTKGGGFQASSTNQLILNLKKGNDRKGYAEYRYKVEAIEIAAGALRQSINPEFLKQATVIPIPPSAAPDDPMYDNRMTLILHKMVEGVGGDVRELVRTRHSMSPAHLTDFRPTPEGLIANYEIVEELATPTPRVIAVVDDLLTAGAHFKAMKTVLVSRFPGVSVIGIFLARRILPPAQD